MGTLWRWRQQRRQCLQRQSSPQMQFPRNRMLNFVCFCAPYRFTSAYRLMRVFSTSCFPACPPLVQDGGDCEGSGGTAFEDGACTAHSGGAYSALRCAGVRPTEIPHSVAVATAAVAATAVPSKAVLSPY